MPIHHGFQAPTIIQGGRAQEAAYEWVEYLNRLLDLDPAFISELAQSRARCNYKIATHPTVQVINLNQMEELLGADPPATPPPPAGAVPYDNRTRYEDTEAAVGTEFIVPDMVAGPRGEDAQGHRTPAQFHSAMNRSLTDMPTPRWAAGMLGVINGFLGISAKGQGPIAAEVQIGTGQIIRFFVTEPYERQAEAGTALPPC